MHLKWFGSGLWMLLIFVQSCKADPCNCEGYYCVSDTEFQLCLDGETVGDPIPCNLGLTCRNDTEKECIPQLSCQENKACFAEGKFADEKSINKYFICSFDENTLEWIRNDYVCPEGKYFSRETSTCIFGDISSVVQSKNTEIYAQEEENSDKNVGYLCLAKGNFPVPRDCQSFYACTGVGIGKLMKCPKDTYYNDKTSICSSEYPETCTTLNAEPGMSPQTENQRNQGLFACPGIGYFPDPQNKQRFFLCYEKNGVLSGHCPENTYFDPASITCVVITPEERLDLVTDASIPTENDKEEFYPTTNDMDSPAATSQADSTITGDRVITTEYPSEDDHYSATVRHISTSNQPSNDDLKDSNFLCPGMGYFPDPKNCRYYYFCPTSMDAIPVSCEGNTYFNEETTLCSTEMPKRCLEITELPRNHTSVTVTTKSSLISTTPSPSEDDRGFICPSEGYFPDPKNCQYYYVCFGDKFIPVSCPENEFYDEGSTFCTSKRPERCNSLQLPSEDHTVSTTDYILEPATPSTPPEEPFICPGFGYFPNSKNCQGYFACYDFGISVQMLCPEGTYYDERYYFCSSKMPERCSQNEPGKWVGPLEPGNESEFVCPSFGIFSDTGNCHKYWICFNRNFGYSITCPRGTYYHENGSICRKEMPQRCRERPDEPFQCTKHGYFADSQNCHTYHICYSNGLHLSVDCPGKTYYDEEWKLCTSNIPKSCLKRIKTNNLSTISDRGQWGSISEMIMQKAKQLIRKTRQITEDIESNTRSNTFKCPGRGKFPDPTDCTKYYTCFGPSPRQLSCRPGMYFDDVSGMCGEEFPERCNSTMSDDVDDGSQSNNADNTTPSTTPAPFECPGRGKFPDPTDCTKYYTCFGPSPRQLSCRPGMYFDDVSGMCGEEFPERCNSTMSDDVDDGSQSNNADNATPSTTPAPFECPGRGKFPDPTDCTKYYTCFGPSPRQLSCRPGMYFDDVSGMCGEEFPERCNSTQGHNLDDGSQSNNADNTTPSTTPAPFECPGRGKFPDPIDCTKYYTCFGPSPRQLSCRPGMYFDDVSGMCGEEFPERCNSTMSDDVDDGSQSNNADNATPSTTPAPFECPGRGKFPDPTDCTKYYTCFGPSPRQLSCRPGMYFDDVSGMCGEEFPERCNSTQGHNLDDGSQSNNADNTTPSTAPAPFECPGKGTFSDPTDCSKFYNCFGPSPKQLLCRPGMYYDDVTEMCGEKIPERCNGGQGNVADGATLPTEVVIPSVYSIFCPGEGLFVDSRDCSKYYDCRGILQIRSCPNGTYFNNKTQLCGSEIPVECEIVPEIIKTPSSTTPSTAVDVKFECRNPGRYPDPKDCRKYFLCSRQLEMYHLTCWNSMYFNDITNSCGVEIPGRCRSDMSSLWTTVEPSLPTGLICWERGNFRNKDDRFSYYYCPGKYFNPIPLKCSKGEYFNEYKKKCLKMVNDDSRSDEESKENSGYSSSEESR